MKATAYDGRGHSIKCDECSDEAGFIIQGIDSRVAYCSAHNPHISTTTLVYKLSQEANESSEPKFKEDWAVDLRTIKKDELS